MVVFMTVFSSILSRPGPKMAEPSGEPVRSMTP